MTATHIERRTGGVRRRRCRARARSGRSRSIARCARNAITAWRADAFEEPYIADRNMLGGFVLLNDPDLIRHVLIDNAANYPKDALQLEKLTPAVGRGLLTADGADWRLQRRTVAPLFQPAARRLLSRRHGGFGRRDAGALGRTMRAAARSIDVAREMTALTYDIISRTVFSHEIETPPDVMGEAITTYFDALGRIDLWDVLPLPRWLPRPAFIRARPGAEDLPRRGRAGCSTGGARASRRARACRTIW